MLVVLLSLENLGASGLQIYQKYVALLWSCRCRISDQEYETIESNVLERVNQTRRFEV